MKSFEELGGLDCLELLEYHANEELRGRTNDILDTYYYKDDDEVGNICGSAQDCGIISVVAMEILQVWAKPSTHYPVFVIDIFKCRVYLVEKLMLMYHMQLWIAFIVFMYFSLSQESESDMEKPSNGQSTPMDSEITISEPILL